MEQGKGFLGMLFDFSFSDFVTTKILKILYGIGIVLAGIGAIAFIVTGFRGNVGLGIVALVLSPLVFLLYVILCRIWIEMVIVLFRRAENLQELVERGRGE